MPRNSKTPGKVPYSPPRAKYDQALKSLPAPGGNGCHVALLGIANHGAFSGISASQIQDDIRARITELGGTRRVPDSEIAAAIRRAFNDQQQTYQPPARPSRRIDGGKVREVLTARAELTEADLWESSPVRLLGDPAADAALLLEALYEDSDLLFVGNRADPGIVGETIRSAASWADYFRAGGSSWEHIIPNPLTGKPAKLKGGEGLTFRGDQNVRAFRFVVVEFDSIPPAAQLAFWQQSKLPLHCLIDSGGKSIHGWVKVEGIETAAAWQSVVRDRLFPRLLVPVGVDSACKNESRLSRLPGHFRSEKANYQKLLWLSKKGECL